MIKTYSHHKRTTLANGKQIKPLLSFASELVKSMLEVIKI